MARVKFGLARSAALLASFGGDLPWSLGRELVGPRLAAHAGEVAVAGAIAAAMARTSTTVQRRNALVMICSSRSLPRGRKMPQRLITRKG